MTQDTTTYHRGTAHCRILHKVLTATTCLSKLYCLVKILKHQYFLKKPWAGFKINHLMLPRFSSIVTIPVKALLGIHRTPQSCSLHYTLEKKPKKPSYPSLPSGTHTSLYIRLNVCGLYLTPLKAPRYTYANILSKKKQGQVLSPG